MQYNTQVLVRLLTETGLQYSTFCPQIEETNFSLFRKISMNATVEIENRCFLKNMKFSGHEFFSIVAKFSGISRSNNQ